VNVERPRLEVKRTATGVRSSGVQMIKSGKMNLVFYTNLNIVSLKREFLIDVDGSYFRVSIDVLPLIGTDIKDPVHYHLYNSVKAQLGTDQFILVPSQQETVLDAYRADQMYHPEKYPTGSDESSGAFGFGDDS
jgi:hypothetical protein